MILIPMNSSINVIYDISYEKLKSQSDNFRVIDTKAAIIIATHGVIISALASKVPEKFACNLILLSFCLAFLALIGGTVLCLVALSVREFKHPPHLPKLKKKYIDKEETETKKVLVASFINAHKHNAKIIKKRIKWLNISMKVCLPISIILSIITIIGMSIGA